MSYPVIIYLLSNVIFFGFLGCFMFGFAQRYSLPKDWRHLSIFRWQELPKNLCATLIPSGLAWYITAGTYPTEISSVAMIAWFIRMLIIGFWIFGYFSWSSHTIKSLEGK